MSSVEMPRFTKKLVDIRPILLDLKQATEASILETAGKITANIHHTLSTLSDADASALDAQTIAENGNGKNGIHKLVSGVFGIFKGEPVSRSEKLKTVLSVFYSGDLIRAEALLLVDTSSVLEEIERLEKSRLRQNGHTSLIEIQRLQELREQHARGIDTIALLRSLITTNHQNGMAAQVIAANMITHMTRESGETVRL